MKPSRERWGVQCLSVVDDAIEAQTMKIISENLFWIRHCLLPAQPHGGTTRTVLIWGCQQADPETKVI